MRMKYAMVAACAVCAFCGFGKDIYLLLGQSNMAGRGKLGDEAPVPCERIEKLDRSDTWVAATEPLHFDKPVAGAGLGMSFARIVADRDRDVMVGLVPCAVGGSPLDKWMPGAPLYAEAVRRAKIAQRGGEIKAILWHQGESDADGGKLEASYVERLAKMVAALRAELGLKAEDVPFILGSLAELEGAPNYEVNRSFNRTVRSVVDRIPNSVRVEGSDLSCNEDKVHFSTRSLRTLGARYAAAYLALKGSRPSAAVRPSDSKCDRWLAQFYGKLPHAEYTIIDRAARSLEGNSGGLFPGWGRPWGKGRAARPSVTAFPGIWNWDCAFMALAMAKWDVELARDQVRTFVRMQLEDGMYPDCWEIGKDKPFTGCTKPPVLSWAALECERWEHDGTFLAESYASLRKNAAWWERRRRREGDRLFHYDGEAKDEETRRLYAGWDSGLDDSPRWDGRPWEIHAIDLNCFMVLNYRCLGELAARLGRTDEKSEWERLSRALSDEINARLWDADSGCYFDWDFAKGRYSRILTPLAFLPLYIGIATPERAAKMAKAAERLSPGWPTVAYDEPTYDPVGYWRGRTWINVAYFALKGLKDYGYGEIAERGRREILGWMLRDPACFHENYNSKTGMPVGAMYFGWSNAFAIKFVLDWEKKGI